MRTWRSEVCTLTLNLTVVEMTLCDLSEQVIKDDEASAGFSRTLGSGAPSHCVLLA